MTAHITSYVISLDPNGPRYQTFARQNAHLEPITIFNAIRGADLSDEVRISSGLLTAELVAAGRITHGTAGCAASHREVWRRIASSQSGAMILEDDVLTHPGLLAFVRANETLLNNCDTLFFGVNTNSVLATVSAQGLIVRELMAPQYPDQAWIESAFAATPLKDVRPYRLLNAFGLCCYWVTPAGAAKLLERCYPLTLEGAVIPFMKEKWPGDAIDSRMNAFFAKLNAYVVRPFLAYSPNTDSSTSK